MKGRESSWSCEGDIGKVTNYDEGEMLWCCDKGTAVKKLPVMFVDVTVFRRKNFLSIC